MLDTSVGGTPALAPVLYPSQGQGKGTRSRPSAKVDVDAANLQRILLERLLGHSAGDDELQVRFCNVELDCFGIVGLA